MKNNFTTPSFAKVLKEHGIKIDTPFYRHSEVEGIFVSKGEPVSGYDTFINIETKDRFGFHESQISPAYPLTEVLGWLPETIICEGKLHQIDFDTVNLTVGYARAKLLEMVWAIEPKNISDIIIQGLTEGWLTKDNLNVNS
jgi:hypothetical protein